MRSLVEAYLDTSPCLQALIHPAEEIKHLCTAIIIFKFKLNWRQNFYEFANSTTRGTKPARTSRSTIKLAKRQKP